MTPKLVSFVLNKELPNVLATEPRLQNVLEDWRILNCALLCFQLTECCVNVLVTSFKETILAECAQMIKLNETDSKWGYIDIAES